MDVTVYLFTLEHKPTADGREYVPWGVVLLEPEAAYAGLRMKGATGDMIARRFDNAFAGPGHAGAIAAECRTLEHRIMKDVDGAAAPELYRLFEELAANLRIIRSRAVFRERRHEVMVARPLDYALDGLIDQAYAARRDVMVQQEGV